MTALMPKPKFGWSKEIARKHQEDLQVRRQELYTPKGDWYLLTDEVYTPPPKPELQRSIGSPGYYDGPDHGALASFEPRDSAWVRFAMVVLEETGKRRAVSTPNCPNDYYTTTTDPDTVYVGTPAT